VIEFLPPFAPGLPRKDFRRQFEERLEAACDRLLAEAASASDPPPLAAEAQARVTLLNEKRT
jgi:1-acyl-sn-glycerol-3-phosphate acyltransferase